MLTLIFSFLSMIPIWYQDLSSSNFIILTNQKLTYWLEVHMYLTFLLFHFYCLDQKKDHFMLVLNQPYFWNHLLNIVFEMLCFLSMGFLTFCLHYCKYYYILFFHSSGSSVICFTYFGFLSWKIIWVGQGNLPILIL